MLKSSYCVFVDISFKVMCFKNNFSNVLMAAHVAEITFCNCNVSADLLYHEVLHQCESDGLRFLSKLWLNFIGVQLVYFCHTVNDNSYLQQV